MANTRTYEIMYIVDPGVSEDDVASLSETFKQVIKDQGGTITKDEYMGKRPLAYPINHKNEGHYTLYEVEGSGSEIAEIERRMRVADQVIRYISVRVDKDRQRAEKFRQRRARKAGRRPFAPVSRPPESAGEDFDSTRSALSEPDDRRVS